jgi:hypothetical protein
MGNSRTELTMFGTRWQMTSVFCLIGLLFGIVPAVHSDPPAKPRVFLVPSRARVYDNKTTIEANDVTAWIKRGGNVTAKVNVGTFFVEAGGTLEISGNCFRIVAAEGATVKSIEGNVIHVHRARNANIGKIDASVDHVTVHDAIEIRKGEKFALTGTVSGIDSKPAAGVKVHAYTLGAVDLTSETTDAQGHFTITTDEEISTLAADLSPRWTDEKRLGRNNTRLDVRQRLNPLQGWECIIAQGPWTEKATVDLKLRERAKVKLEELRALPSRAKSYPLYPSLRFSPDSSSLLVLWEEPGREKDAEAQLWTTATSKQVATFAVKPMKLIGNTEWCAFSPDGKLFALIGSSGIQVHKLPGGARLLELPCQVGDHHCLAFSPGGDLLAEGGDRDIAIFDLGKKTVRRRIKGHEAGTTALAFSQDGKTLLSAGQIILRDIHFTLHTGESLRHWDIATGKEIGNPPGDEGQLEFSSSGLILSSGHVHRTTRDANKVTSRTEDFVSVADPSSKRELFRLKERGRNAVFTLDGRLVVTVGGGMVRFVETATGQEALTVPIPEYWSPCFALSPGGKLLATSRDDGSILLWDLSWDRLRVPESAPAFTDATVEQFWKDLTGDAAGAYRLIWQLSKSPESAVQFLKSRLQPTPVQELPIKKWLEELGSGQFKVREGASAELRKNGRAAEPALRAALKEKLPLEVQRRIEMLLGELEARPLSIEELRQVRAIAILEWIGTPEARQLLKTLAAGWSESAQTKEAATALRRLSR